MTVPIRDAATVVLLRDGEGGVEAWLLTRVARMAFAAGMTVFPGGRVEASDADLPWAGPPPADAALVGAAVRETFEETGVLLGVAGLDLGSARADVEAGRLGFGSLLREHGATVDPSGLHPWARWVTPEGESRRYDTRFFVAALPSGAAPAAVTSEAEHAGWLGVAAALAERERGERALMPPTIVTLGSIAAFVTVADVIAAAPGRSLQPVRPVLHVEADGARVELPDGTSMRLPS
jgi:8-oxo-dGTP pyrophosphatase MutT (NUDIX family)